MTDKQQPPGLSKSQYIQGQRCPKALWLAKNRKDLKGTFGSAQQGKIEQGQEIGDLAQKYFGDGVEVRNPAWDTEGAIHSTKKFIAQGHNVIFEATAANPDGTFSRIDALRRVPGTDEWDLIEVKGTTKVKPYHADDLSFQYHAFTGAGYRIRNCLMMIIDNQYVRQGALDLQKLFKFVDITAEVKQKEAAIGAAAQELIQIRGLKNMPEADIGAKCDEPFTCDFKKHCWKDVPASSVFNVCSMTDAEKIVKQTGSYEINDIPDDMIPRNRSIDIASHKTGQEHVEPEKLQAFLERLQYPLYFLDYETLMSGAPFYDGTRPFQHVPFQFSLHVQNEPGGPVEHHEFIHKERSDPRAAFTEELVRLLGDTGSVIVYNQDFEESRNKELASRFPQHAQALNKINARMIDLYEPFKNRWLYSPAQNGSASIKAVLPAFTDMKYDDLAVSNGVKAMNLYADFVRGKINIAEDLKRFWDGFSKYCEMDTLAEVKLVEALRIRAAPKP